MKIRAMGQCRRAARSRTLADREGSTICENLWNDFRERGRNTGIKTRESARSGADTGDNPECPGWLERLPRARADSRRWAGLGPQGGRREPRPVEKGGREGVRGGRWGFRGSRYNDHVGCIYDLKLQRDSSHRFFF